MRMHFGKIARGPAWERWAILEDQLGDTAVAGEVIITYTDFTTYADVECDVLFSRELSGEELEDAMNSLVTILSGRGNINIYTANEVISQEFSLLDDDILDNPN